MRDNHLQRCAVGLVVFGLGLAAYLSVPGIAAPALGQSIGDGVATAVGITEFDYQCKYWKKQETNCRAMTVPERECPARRVWFTVQETTDNYSKPEGNDYCGVKRDGADPEDPNPPYDCVAITSSVQDCPK